jgi:hypothetical protein
MSRKEMLWLFVLCLIPLGSAAQVRPALTADFTLTVTPAGAASHQIAGHYARSGDGKIREETPAFVTIADPKTRTITLLNPATKEATVIQASRDKTPADRETAFPSRSESQLGEHDTTAVEGHPVVKKRSSASDGATREVWMATDISLPVLIKTSNSMRSSTKTFSNITVSEPDPALFTIPKDYKVTTKTDNGLCPLPECRTGPAPGLPRIP